MKKIYALVFLLIIMCIGSFVVVGTSVAAQKDQVRLKETVLYGDSSAAEGVTITTRTNMGHHLFWDTTCKVGEELVCDTEYDFSVFEKLEVAEHVCAGIEIMSDIQPYTAYYGYGYNQEKNEEGINKALKDLFDRTELGETKREIVYLKDYYDYYPLRVFIELGNYSYSFETDNKNIEDNIVKGFQEFFKIPVLDEDFVTIEVSKKEQLSNGTFSSTHSVDTMSTELYWYSSASGYSDDTCYFSISPKKEMEYGEQYVDTSQIPGGYGIYGFSYKNEGNVTNIDMDSLKMVFPLDKEVLVERIIIRNDGRRMLLFTSENDKMYVRIVDIDSMTELEKFLISAERNYLYYDAIHEYEDFIAVIAGDVITVISDDNGNYVHEFTIPLHNILGEDNSSTDKYFYITEQSAMDFDGEKLVVSGQYYWRNGYDTCDFYMSIYDKSGLIYCGEYNSSLSREVLYQMYGNDCHPNDENPYAVRWD